MGTKKPLTSRSAKKLSDRERGIGVEPDDEASRWLAENDARPEVPRPKAASKSKHLHRWRRQNPKS